MRNVINNRFGFLLMPIAWIIALILGLLFGLALPVFACEADLVTTQPTYYWKLENTTASIGGLNLSIGTYKSATGKFGNGNEFDGSNYLKNTSVTYSTGATWSVSFWYYDNSAGTAYRDWLFNSDASFFLREADIGGDVINYNPTYNYGDSPTKGAWVRYSFVCDGTDTHFYKNGSQVLTSNGCAAPASGMTIGDEYSGGGGARSIGIIDDLAIWKDYILTSGDQDTLNAETCGGGGTTTTLFLGSNLNNPTFDLFIEKYYNLIILSTTGFLITGLIIGIFTFLKSIYKQGNRSKL